MGVVLAEAVCAWGDIGRHHHLATAFVCGSLALRDVVAGGSEEHPGGEIALEV
jgi:hypothetical protein